MSDDYGESIIWGLIRRRREKKQKQQLLENIETNNQNGKGIVEYNPAPIEWFFNQNDLRAETIISGGHQTYRNRSIIGLINQAVQSGQKTVVLHSGNNQLETMLKNISGTKIFDRRTPSYDPLLSLTDIDIIRIIQSSSMDFCKIESAGKYYLEGMLNFIRSKNTVPYCDMMFTCPHFQLLDKIDDAEAKGQLNSVLAQKIRSLIVQGQMQRGDIENYFVYLQNQSVGLIATRNTIGSASNITLSLKNHNICSVDIGNVSNALLLDVVFSDLMNVINSGKRPLVILDDIPISTSKKVETFVKGNGLRCPYALSSKDIYSLSGGDENLFTTIMGNAGKVVLLKHSGSTSNKLAEMIGYYDKVEVNDTYSSANHYESMFAIVPDQTSTQGFNLSNKREFRVKPEVISSLRDNEGFILDIANNELAHIEIQ